MQRNIYYLQEFLKILGVTLVALAIVEILLRCGFWVYDLQVDYRFRSDIYNGQEWATGYFNEDPQAKLEWQSYVYWRHKPFKGTHINVDQNGLRSTFNVADPTATRQVYFLGGSTLWGVGVRDNYTIPSLVSKQLGDLGCRDVYVSNYGEIGYVSSQEIASLMLVLRQGKRPTVVVFYDGINDTFSAFQNGTAGLPLNEFNRRAEFALEDGEGWYFPVLKQLALYRLAEVIARRVTTVMPSSSTQKTGLPQDVLSTYAANVRLVHSLAAEYGFAVYYFWQPVLYSKSVLSTWEQNEAGKQTLGTREFFGKVYNTERDSNEFKSLNNFHDISHIFDNVPDSIFIDTWHVSEAGNAIVAEAITRVIQGPLACSQ